MIFNNGGGTLPYRADVSKECEVLDVVTHIISMLSEIDFLVKNASITSQVPMS